MSEEVGGRGNITAKSAEGPTVRLRFTISGRNAKAGCIEQLLEDFKRRAREECGVRVVIERSSGARKKAAKKKATRK